MLENSRAGIEELEDIIKLFSSHFSKFVLRGLTSQQMPPSTYAIPLLNIRNLLEGESLREVEYMIALALINGKRFIQATEILRKLETHILLNSDKALDSQLSKKSPKVMSSAHNRSLRHFSFENDSMSRSSKIEILIADCMNQHFQLFEKMQALKRATDLYLGVKLEPICLAAPTKYSREDIYTSLIKMHPHLTQLLLSNMKDSSEAQRSATLKCLDFVLENMGCSLGSCVINILKVIIQTYPSGHMLQFHTDSFNISAISISSFGQTNISPLSRRKEESKKRSQEYNTADISNRAINQNAIVFPDQSEAKYISIYNRLLETYASVLSSISSQILHKVFYEVIVSQCFLQELSPNLRNIMIKIADKIVAICQGDLLLPPHFLTAVVKEQRSSNEHIAASAQDLWNTIKTKLCPNCSPKCKKQIVGWLIENLIEVAEKMASHEGSKITAEEDAVLKLGIYIELACILTADRQSEEEANSLVLKNRVDDKVELFSLLNPLIFWLSFSMATEGRMELFKQTWQCTSNLLNSLRETINFDMNTFLFPILGKVNEYCKSSSPTLPMLQFLQIVLKDLKETNAEMLKFLVELTDNICSHMPSYPYEEIFGIFDNLLMVVFGNLTEKVFRNLFEYITDRYTIKSKRQNESLKKFLQQILSQSINENREDIHAKSFFDIILDVCIIENRDINPNHPKIDNKKAEIVHERFMERLNFLMEMLKILGEAHKELFNNLIYMQGLDDFLKELIANGHSSIRLKAHEILEIISSYYIENNHPNQSEGELIRKEQLIIGKLILDIAKRSLENVSDSYIQFNSLILLDLMFQTILPVPSFQSEIQKKNQRSPGKNHEIIDLELLDRSEAMVADIKATDFRYLNMRMLIVLKLWTYVQNALNSPWSNIRSISYGLLCSMLKIDVKDYRSTFKDKLKGLVLPLIVGLLESKESESKAGGLNILGSFCGLSYDVMGIPQITEHLPFFRRNSSFISLAIWQHVFDLQDDWDSTIREAATVLVQLSAPRESASHFHKVKAEARKLKLNCLATNFGNFGLSAATKILKLERTGHEEELINLLQQSSDLQLSEELVRREVELKNPENEQAELANESASFEESGEESEENNELFFVDKYSDEQLKDTISIFKNDFKPPKNLWIEKNPSEYIEGEGEGEEVPPQSKPLVSELAIPEAGNRRFNMTDNLEDKLVENIQTGYPKENTEDAEPPAPKKETIEDLNKKDSLEAGSYKFLNSDEEINQDDLEIIELQDEEFLRTLEEDKVPVLKNSYANKKNKRPKAPKPGSNSGKAQVDLRSPQQKAAMTTNNPVPIKEIKLQDNVESQPKEEEKLPEMPENFIKAGEVEVEAGEEDETEISLRLKKNSGIINILNYF